MIKTRTLVPVLLACGALLSGASAPAALEEVSPGISRIDSKTMDDLLTLRERADLCVLLLEDDKEKSISDAHMKMLRQWVESGGILWVAGDGLESSLAQTVAPFRHDSFDFVRSSSGNRGGELIVRGLSQRMTIADHALTADVSQLYLFVRSKFDGTERAEPLVQMGDTSGNSGWVLVAVPVGRGLMILDGTARKGNGLFRRLKGFDDSHLNSLKQDSVWNNYDWGKLQNNARELARWSLAGVPGHDPAGVDSGGKSR